MIQKIKILFLAANPTDTTKLRLDEEFREVDNALQRGGYRDYFELEQQWAVRVSDLQAHLLRYQPDIVHFSGHGSENSEILLEDDAGQTHVVPQKALGRLFKLFKNQVRCVVLNACFSKEQAQVIAEHIDCVIGMSQAIGDKAAIQFALAFYQALSFGKNVHFAFDSGCAQIELGGLNEQDKPRLIALRRNPEEIIMLPERMTSLEPSNPTTSGDGVPYRELTRLIVLVTGCIVILITILGFFIALLNGTISNKFLGTIGSIALFLLIGGAMIFSYKAIKLSLIGANK